MKSPLPRAWGLTDKNVHPPRPSPLALRSLPCLVACLVMLTAPRALAADEVDYARDVQPILAQHCYKCHGADEQESGLRLDTASGVLEGGYSGPALVAGKSGESLIIKALTGTGDVQQMPDQEPPLPEEQIALLAGWIDQGAKLPADEDSVSAAAASDHWSYKPIVRPALPPLANESWLRNPIDAFILARLEAAGLAPSPEADRATLIRRLSLDLLGLLPSVAEVDEFLADESPDAYERLVNRLLDSPHYGERWGRHWLDQARYADSNGYTIDGGRSVWKYRDWVIEALNRDLPFDQFTIEQVAGDMLPGATVDQIVATGFHRNTLKNEEGGTDQEQFRVEAVVDRVSTTSSVFLGLTLGCARCHDHKYDPVSQREFYQFFALLNNSDEPSLPVPTDQQAREEPALLAEIAQVEKRLKDLDDNSPGRQADWEQQFAGRLDVPWTVLEAEQFVSAGGATITRLDDQSLLVEGAIPDKDIYTIVAPIPADGMTALRLEVLTDDRLPQRGPGLAENGNFVLSEMALAAQPAGDAAASADTAAGPAATLLIVSQALADYSHESGPVAQAIDGKPETGWTIYAEGGSLNVDRAANFILEDDLHGAVAPGSTKLVVTLRHEYEQPRYSLGRFRLSATSAPRDVLAVPDKVRLAMAVPLAERSDEQKQLVRDEFNRVDKERIPLTMAHAELKQRHQQLASSITTSLVMQERQEPRETHIMIRGDFLRPGALVRPGVPAVLPPLAAAGDVPNRLDLAQWLVSPQNPLTPRVTMNRLWQQYFGQGLVVTENDFGTQGTPPTHPELLDWLASELIAQGWRLKAMHKLIVFSATYRQSSAYRPDLAETDPGNKLLGRQPRLRLEAEVIRDVALAASGLLSREVGGPGVYPPQPEGIYRFTQQVKFWKESTGADRYRRGMYTYFWRSSPYPFLTTFDTPDANTACTRRVRSNTPLQALTLANDRVFIELAQGLAARVLREAPQDDAQRIRHAVRLCVAREPSAVESQRLTEFLASQRSRFAAAPQDAEAVAPADRPAQVDPVEGASWAAVARVLLNLDEFITRE